MLNTTVAIPRVGLGKVFRFMELSKTVVNVDLFSVIALTATVVVSIVCILSKSTIFIMLKSIQIRIEGPTPFGI